MGLRGRRDREKTHGSPRRGSSVDIRGPVGPIDPVFSVTGNEYDRFMGRYSMALAPAFAAFAGAGPGMRLLDVGCGTGALTAELVKHARPELVSAIDPAPQFVDVCRARAPGADVRVGPAEQLPWPDGEFDRVLAQLVLPFLADAAAAVVEMRRVARPSGTVAACMWGSNDEMELTGTFWRAASRVEVGAPGDRLMRFRNEGEIAALFRGAGYSNIESAPLDVTATYASFDDFWQSILGGAGSIGAYVSKLDPLRLADLQGACREELHAPEASYRLRARAWAVRARGVK
jgi:SAM-dependent methyltransferase